MKPESLYRLSTIAILFFLWRALPAQTPQLIAYQTCACFPDDTSATVDEKFASCLNSAFLEQGLKTPSFLKNIIANKDSLSAWVRRCRKICYTECDEIIRAKSVERSAMYRSSSVPRADTLFELGNEALAKGRHAEANGLFLSAWELDTGFIKALDNYALTYRVTGNLDQAETYYLESIRRFPEGFFARQNLAVVYFYKKDYNKALEVYQEMMVQDPSNPEGYYGVANTLLAVRQKWDIAESMADTVIQLYEKTESPILADGYRMKGYIQYFADQKKAAKKTLQKAKDMGAEIPEEMAKELKLK